MKLVFLGTSAAQPTSRRGLSCICLNVDGEILMFDAGEGAQVAYARSGMGWNKKMRVFITHMHGDHCIGILGLLQTMSMQKRTEPLWIYGPKGIDDFVEANIRILGFGLSFPVMIHIVEGGGPVVDGGGYSVSACRAEHRVPAFSYLFIENDRPGRFRREEAVRLGIPEGPLWGTLQRGQSVTVNGKEMLSSQVLGPGRRGRRIGVSGDTRPTIQLGEFFRDCDYLVFDSTFAGDLKDKALETSHSTAGEAAALARDANAKNLILTHFSARYGDVSVLEAEAGRIHGSVVAACDMMEIEIV